MYFSIFYLNWWVLLAKKRWHFNQILNIKIQVHSVKSVLHNQLRDRVKWPLMAGYCLIQVIIQLKWTFEIARYWPLKASSNLIEVIRNTRLTVLQTRFMFLFYLVYMKKYILIHISGIYYSNTDSCCLILKTEKSSINSTICSSAAC